MILKSLEKLFTFNVTPLFFHCLSNSSHLDTQLIFFVIFEWCIELKILSQRKCRTHINWKKKIFDTIHFIKEESPCSSMYKINVDVVNDKESIWDVRRESSKWNLSFCLSPHSWNDWQLHIYIVFFLKNFSVHLRGWAMCVHKRSFICFLPSYHAW